MKNPPNSPPYSVLGRFYDQVTRGGPAMNRHARKQILGRFLRRPRVVCDLGCGTGTTAIELARAGHKVYGVDASPVQVQQARDKIRCAGVAVRVLRADMRRFRLPEAVNLVLCEFNPVNHLARKGDLLQAFRSVARALRPGGLFYFDLNMRATYVKLYPTTRWEEDDGFCVVSRGGVDEPRRKAWIVMDWFVLEHDRWRRYRERIEDTWWTNAEIRSTLRQAGFGRIRTWDGARVRPPKMKPRPGYDRYYLAERAGN